MDKEYSYKINKKNITDILSDLIEFESVTPKSAGSIEYIADFLSDIGFKCDIQKFGEGENQTTNMYAYYKNNSENQNQFNLCFAGHVDVVPIIDIDLWDYDPFKMSIKDDIIYGRGIVDMKGSIACFLAAIKQYITEQDTDNIISVLLTSDEEGSGKYGMKKMLEYLSIKWSNSSNNSCSTYPKIDFCILGEPTSEKNICDIMKIGRKGSINFTLKIYGVGGHAAYPTKTVNPIHLLNKIIDELLKIKFIDESKYFDKTCLNFTSIDCGNETTNVIPNNITAKFNIRFDNNYCQNKLIEIVNQIITIHTKNYKLEHKCSAESFVQNYSSNMKKFVTLIQKILNNYPQIKNIGGTSDARFIHKYTEVIECGLFNEHAHAVNERSEISNLHSLSNVYYYTIKEFLD